jgi:hypothetical protein
VKKRRPSRDWPLFGTGKWCETEEVSPKYIGSIWLVILEKTPFLGSTPGKPFSKGGKQQIPLNHYRNIVLNFCAAKFDCLRPEPTAWPLLPQPQRGGGGGNRAAFSKTCSHHNAERSACKNLIPLPHPAHLTPKPPASAALLSRPTWQKDVPVSL